MLFGNLLSFGLKKIKGPCIPKANEYAVLEKSEISNSALEYNSTIHCPSDQNSNLRIFGICHLFVRLTRELHLCKV